MTMPSAGLYRFGGSWGGTAYVRDAGVPRSGLQTEALPQFPPCLAAGELDGDQVCERPYSLAWVGRHDGIVSMISTTAWR
jgi:hypothetical protein